jgi:hypothetical protein
MRDSQRNKKGHVSYQNSIKMTDQKHVSTYHTLNTHRDLIAWCVHLPNNEGSTCHELGNMLGLGKHGIPALGEHAYTENYS